jgi:hypothetical protein
MKVESNITSIRNHFDYLLSKGILSSFEDLSYFNILKKVIFDDLIFILKYKEKYYDKSRGETNFYLTIMERNLLAVNNKHSRESNSYEVWKKKASREEKLNKLLIIEKN